MVKTVYDIAINDIKGQPLNLAQYKGKKLLLVNTASACGLTPQYKQLEELHRHYKEKLQVIGLPCNDFGEQEPGSADEIVQFCEVNYGVSFPLSEKVKILGDNPHALYAYLLNKEQNGYKDSEVKWNFQKYLIDENGYLVKIFSPMAEPLSEEILNALEN